MTGAVSEARVDNMSGGYFDYKDLDLSCQIEYRCNTNNPFEDLEISELVKDVLALIHDFDWYKSGDTCEDSYLQSKRDFKKKWLSSKGREETIRRMVDESIDRLKEELYKTYEIRSDDNGH